MIYYVYSNKCALVVVAKSVRIESRRINNTWSQARWPAA